MKVAIRDGMTLFRTRGSRDFATDAGSTGARAGQSAGPKRRRRGALARLRERARSREGST